ncbi:DUF4097 family beta strand repeat-containing protein [Paenibacillus wenxiniae]|uniref:DUF4097 domain-containing protein n=1 Tax=Paenibacillus wenxiniae TaxID=1636843 RepID=A0ABW4RQT8_9BACL
MNRWIGIGLLAAGVLGLAAFTKDTLQLGNPPQNQTYEHHWELPAGAMKQLDIQSDYEIAVQFVPSPDGQDHVTLKGAVISSIRQQLARSHLQGDALQLNLGRQQQRWQLVKPRVQPHVQYITVQLAQPDSLQLANFRLSSAQTNLNHVQAKQIRVQSGSGRIKAQQLDGNTELTTSSGDISIHTWNGSKLNLHSGSGQLQIGTANGHVYTSTGSGALQIDQLGGDANIASHSGNVKLMLTGSHDIDVHVRSANIHIDADSTFAGTYQAYVANEQTERSQTSAAGSAHIDAYSDSGQVTIKYDE